MSRITPVDDTATDEQKALLDAVKSLLGATPNMTTTMARSAVLEGWLNLNGALRKGSIGTADAERVALGVAEANGCSYCLSAHTYLGANVARLDDVELTSSRPIPRARRFSPSRRRFSRPAAV
jgi:AhpD family alkylhydroperoxidase